MEHIFPSILMFYIPYLCPQWIYVEKGFDRVIETVQIQSAENNLFYDVFQYR